MVRAEIHLDKVCRSCLKENSDMLQIQNTVDIHCLPNTHFTIAEVLMECTAVKVQLYDELPQSICSECVGRVRDAFIYKKMCEDSDDKLRNYLSGELQMDINPKMGTDECETNSLPTPEVVHLTDSHMRDDLFDENHGDIFGDSRMQSDCDSEPIETADISETCSKDEYKQGEDFRLVNRAKRINGRFQCELCEKTLADRRTFLLHTRLHLGKNLKHCEICGKGFAKKNHLDRHKKVHSSKTSERIRPNPSLNEPKLESQKSEENHEEHFVQTKLMKLEKESDQHSIDVIGEKSVNIAHNEDEQQLLNSAKEVNGRLQCPICPRTLSQRKILRLHIRSHIGKNLLHCTICNRGFAKGSNLNRHKLLHCTVDNDEENQIIRAATQSNGCFSCPFCAKTLIDRQTFRLHIRLHISKGLVRCEICNRGFEDDNELQKHMTTHGNEFGCNHCDQIFNTYFDRKHHLRTEHNANFKSIGTFVNWSEYTNGNSKLQYHSNHDDEDKCIVNESNCVNGRFECVFCKKTLANRTTLKYHIRLHLGKHLFKCDICDQGFSKKSHLKRHIETHAKKKPCRHCDAVFETYEERKIHSAAVHKDIVQNYANKTIIPTWTQSNGHKQCVCMICDKSFDQIYELKDHLNWHTNEPTSFDGINFSMKENILSNFNDISRDSQDIGVILYEKLKSNSEHLSKLYCITNEQGWELSLSDSETENECHDDKQLTKPYNCERCHQHFDRLHKLICHIKVDHSTAEFQAFKCKQCSQYFPNAIILAKHLRQQCENQNKHFVCLLCNNRFTWKSSLDKHVAIYHEIDSKYIHDKQSLAKSFNCDQCIKSFHRMDQLAAHKLSHIPRQKRFSCEICKKRFSRTDNLKSHMRIHIPIEEREIVNKHLCSYCGRSFSNSSNLTVHIRRHTGERPFSCEFCDARFPRSSDLQCHRRTHTGEKTCMCTVCGKGFTRSNKLVRHMRIHTGEKPYKCKHCGRAFTQSNDLTLHVRRHTGDKPFGCNCGERFITNSLLQSHRRSAGHTDDATITLPSNSVNNPHRKFNINDGKRTGITATLSSYLFTETPEESDKMHIQNL